METILITGGTGTIGKRLSQILTEKGYAVRHLSRSPSPTTSYPAFKWNIEEKYINPKALNNIDHIIHLSGENVGEGRWSSSRKKRILSSRVDTVHLLKDNYKGTPLKSFISASGISYYGSKTSPEIFKENAPAGNDFLAQVSAKWEDAVRQFSATNRTVILRTGVVLSPGEGALEKLSKPINMGIGSALGNGKQYVPWIHLEDICQMYVKAIEDNNMKGIYNAVASEHCTNEELTIAIAKQLGKKLWMPKVPSFVLHTLFGEMATIILEGSRIDNNKIKATGFHLEYDRLDKALNSLLL